MQNRGVYAVCPQCGMPLSNMACGPVGAFGPMGFGGQMGYGWGVGYGPGIPPWMGAPAYGQFGGWGVGVGPTWGGTYAPPAYFGTAPSDEEIANMIYDALDADPIIPYDSDINVDVTAGVVTLTGTVPSKRIKHAAGDDAWWVPGVIDINNQLTISGRRGRGEGQGSQSTASESTGSGGSSSGQGR